MGKRRSASEVAAVLREFTASGMTRREFSARRGIAMTTLDSWRMRERRRAQLVQVEVEEGATGAFTLSLRNGRRIESGWQFAEEALARLIRLVESV